MTDHPDPYQHSTRADLVNLIADKDRVIAALMVQNRDLRREMARYHREARDGAQVIGGILRVLRDNGIENVRRAVLTLDEALLIAATLNTTLSWLSDFEGPACTHCQDNPPEGYACKVCLADHDVRWKPEEKP